MGDGFFISKLDSRNETLYDDDTDCPDGPEYTEEPVELESCEYDLLPHIKRSVAVYLVNEGIDSTNQLVI